MRRSGVAYVEQVCGDLIPEVARRELASAVDVFVEREAWSVVEAEMIFAAAQRLGLGVKLHSDQFHRVGGVELGCEGGGLERGSSGGCGGEGE